MIEYRTKRLALIYECWTYNLFYQTMSDVRQLFRSLELAPESRHLRVFQEGNKFYDTRSWQALKPLQGELNAAVWPISVHIKDDYLISDDLTISTKTNKEHVQVIEVMKAMQNAGLTLTLHNCQFGQKSISIWGMFMKQRELNLSPQR